MKVGIDLGTTFSLVSALGPDGKAFLIPDTTFRQDLFTPSIVHLRDDHAFVGRMVEPLIEQDPQIEVIRFFKRKFGDANPIFYDKMGTSWYPEAMGALILKKLKFDAEGYSGDVVDGAVITIPAHFNDPQRRAVLNAAALVDLPVLGLVEEPVAAALHYGIKNKATDEVILVYDLGGGTFDVTLLTLDDNGVYVLAKDGLTELGGKEFDERIGDMILQQYAVATGAEADPDAKMLLQLRRISEEIKIELCMPGQSFVTKTCLLGNVPLEVAISRKEFEEAINEAVDSTEKIMERCINGSGLTKGDISSVLLVGGSSMVPMIKERIKSYFSDVSDIKINFHEPMKAVASGAAVHTAQLTGEALDFDLPPELRGVSGHHIGIRTVNPRTGRVSIDTLIKKNLPLPIKVSKTYYTTRPDQKQMVVEFVQYLDDKSEFVSLGNLVVGPFSFPQNNYPVEISVEYKESGIIEVEAYDPQTGAALNQSFGNDAENASYLATQKALVNSTVVNNIG